MNDRLQPVLIAGAVIGVLGGIPLLNCGCCFWGLGGGMLASWLYLRNQSPVFVGAQPDVGQGALLGAGAGAIGAVIAGVMGWGFSLAMGSMFDSSSIDFSEIEGIPPELADSMTNMFASGGAGCIGLAFNIGVGLFGYGLLGALGGMLGAALFTPKAPPSAPVAPPPPPDPTTT